MCGILNSLEAKINKAKQWSWRVALMKVAKHMSPLAASKIAALVTAHKLGFVRLVEAGETITAEMPGMFIQFHDVVVWGLAAVVGVPLAVGVAGNKRKFAKREAERQEELAEATAEAKKPAISDVVDYPVKVKHEFDHPDN